MIEPPRDTIPVTRSRGQGDIAQEHSSMDREIIHALFALLDERIAVDLPRQLLGFAANFFERLVNGHRADRHRGVADDPFAGLVNVLASRKVHHRVCPPLGGPAHFFDLFLDAGGHRAVANVGIDLHQEIAPDDHRLALWMIDVGGDNCAAPRHLVPYKFSADVAGDRCAEGLTAQITPLGVASCCVRPAHVRGFREWR